MTARTRPCSRGQIGCQIWVVAPDLARTMANGTDPKPLKVLGFMNLGEPRQTVRPHLPRLGSRVRIPSPAPVGSFPTCLSDFWLGRKSRGSAQFCAWTLILRTRNDRPVLSPNGGLSLQAWELVDLVYKVYPSDITEFPLRAPPRDLVVRSPSKGPLSTTFSAAGHHKDDRCPVR